METEKKTVNKGGLKKGQTNNPKGKPKGTKNKLTVDVKQKIADYIGEGFDDFKKTVSAITNKTDQARIYIELCKMIIPKPVDPIAKKEEDKFHTEFMKRLFPNRDE